MGQVELFLIGILIIFAIPYLVWRLGRTDAYAPLVVVQIVGGVLLGPGVLGAVLPGWYAFVFTPQVLGALTGVAWWAVIMFVWIAGIELDVGAAWDKRGETAITALFALATPMAAGCLVASVLFAWPGWIGVRGSYVQGVVGAGMACAVTALPILVLFLEKLGLLHHPLGQRMLRYASLDDLAIWGVLALVVLDWHRLGRQVGFLLLFPLVAFAVRRMMERISEADRWYVGLIWLAACALAADWAGLHFMVGAFLAGVTLDSRWFDRSKLDAFRQNVLFAVMPVFFLSTGLKTQWQVGGVAVFGAAALFLAASVSGKLIGVQIAGRILGWRKGEALVIGWFLQTKALIMIIFATVLLDKQIITSGTFTALLLMAVGSTMLTVPMVRSRLTGVLRA